MRTDYILDESFDIIIRDNDFVVDDADRTNKVVNIMANKGHFNQYPRIGCNIQQELNGILNQNVRRRILESFKLDKYNLKGIRFVNNQIYLP